MKYAFILGNHSQLSILEVLHVFKRENIQVNIEYTSQEFLVLEIEDNFDVQYIMKQLGGTIKIVEIVKKFQKYSYKKLFPLLLSYLNSYLGVNARVKFGFSLYLANSDLTSNAIKHYQKRFFRLGMSLKSELKNQGKSVKVVVSKERVLSSVILQKQSVLEHGEDFCICTLGNNSFYLGKTVAYQDFEQYSKIDYGRPARDDKSGMLPPKLAKMLLNFAVMSKDSMFLDPHCGSGTVLQEALLLGYENILGTDISQKAVLDTQKNLQWLRDNFVIQKDQDLYIDLEKNIFVADVQKLSQFIEENSIDFIVTEPYMGQGVTFRDAQQSDFKKDRVQVMQELEELYLNSFREFKKVLKPGARIVMIFPQFIVNKNTTISVKVLDKIHGFGFEVLHPYKDIINYTQRGSLVYHRDGQHVAREIFIWKLVS